MLSEVWRCDRSGNPIGTDTVMIGAPPCSCQACRMSREIDRLRSTPCAVPEEEIERLRKIETAARALKFSAYPAHGQGFVIQVSGGNINDLEAALAASPPAPAVHDGDKPAEKEGWEPISTAPKDGTKIDICSVYEASYGPPQVFLHRDSQWRHGGWHDFGWNNIDWRNQPDDPDEPGSWASRRAFCWRPVPVTPAPPAQGDR